MSRLEKARIEKQRVKKKTFMVIVVIILVILAAAAFYLLQGGSPDIFGDEEPRLIDKERTVAFIDYFQLTYVRVYLENEVTAAEVTADGERLSFNDEHERWNIVLSGYNPGDELVIIVVDEDRELTQEETVVIEELEVN